METQMKTGQSVNQVESELGEDGGSGEELDTSIGKSGRDHCCGRSGEPSVSLQSKNRCC